MFCNQCEQTARGYACEAIGVCGKTPETDVLQDLLIYYCAGISKVSLFGERQGKYNSEVDDFIMEALFSTLTNVNFDSDRFVEYIERAYNIRESLKKEYGYSDNSPTVNVTPPSTKEALLKQAEELELRPEMFKDDGEDIASLKFTILYSLKGISAYFYHAAKLGVRNDEVARGLKELLVAIFEDKSSSLNVWVQRALETGRLNLLTMEALDKANTGTFGNPVPTVVPLSAKKGKAILVSGHDLKDLYELLKQTEGKGVYIYTHGEMLPAHGYPELKRFKHLYGHFGTAWQNQQREFPNFPGPMLFTTNCLMPPKPEYKDRVFTCGPVGYPGVKHIRGEDFTPVVEMALSMEGYKEDIPGKEVLTGFAHNAVLSVADKVIELVKSGKIRHFFLVGGCDGAKPGRNYYTKFVELLPKDTVVLTLGCGKFRFFDKELGSIDGIPRYLDCGQCNDAYSAIQIALALSKAFGVGVNELPLSLIVSWYEQKAVAIFLTLLYLNIKNIRLGPSMPAFLSKNVTEFIASNYNLKPVGDPEADIKEILG
ncbi:MAG: hydroxylamine reductase [Thermosulfidibacteraceae bacterium]|jgi:hydroxylamine reductase